MSRTHSSAKIDRKIDHAACVAVQDVLLHPDLDVRVPLPHGQAQNGEEESSSESYLVYLSGSSAFLSRLTLYENKYLQGTPFHQY